MTSEFDLHKTNNHTKTGNPEWISCHNGLVYVLEQVHHNPPTVTLKHIDNINGTNPDPHTIHFEAFPQGLRAGLKQEGIQYRECSGSLHGVM